MGEMLTPYIQPKVSIIIPVYNTQEYLVASVQSIIDQTLKEIEIIIVDDGSTDDSLQIIREIALKDNRIQVLSKKNEGPSEARNMGISLAKGKYIYYMDSDDLLEKETLITCYERCERDELDFVFFDATAFKEDLSESVNDYYIRSNVLNDERVSLGEDVLNLLMNVNLYRSAVWLCFVSHNYLNRVDLRFLSGIIHEDELYSALLHINAQRVGYISKPFFRRRVRPNSITSKQFSVNNMDCYYVVLSKLIEYANTKGKDHKLIVDKLCAYILNPAIYRSSSFSFSERVGQFMHCIKNGLMKYITTKNKVILLFPFLIKLKSFFK